jgi:hypothetical protein
MAVKKANERIVRTAAPLPPILVGGRTRASGTHLEFWLALLLRGVAVIWIGLGLLQWFAVLTDENGMLPAHASPLRVAALFFFCVLDFVAAVGLWMVTTWGAAVWIVTIAGHALAALFAPDLLAAQPLVLISDTLLAAAYLVLTALAVREERRR